MLLIALSSAATQLPQQGEGLASPQRPAPPPSEPRFEPLASASPGQAPKPARCAAGAGCSAVHPLALPAAACVPPLRTAAAAARGDSVLPPLPRIPVQVCQDPLCES